MQKIIIIGGGFAGLFAAARLKRYRRCVEVMLIDKKGCFNFLPMLPDIIGKKIEPKLLANSFEALSECFGFTFIQEEITSIDPERKQVIGSSRSYAYDYLLITSGTETNFYGDNMIRQFAFTLDTADDAEKILEAVKHNDFSAFLVGGGGYTGIEAAASLRRHLDSRKQDAPVIIIERAPSILGPLPEWMKKYVLKNLGDMRIEIRTSSTITAIKDNMVGLSTGESFQNAMLIWAAGVKTADFLQRFEAAKNPQGRLLVDEYLQVENSVFAAGDAACVKYRNSYLRMAVQFAIMEGRAAASNIIRSMKEKPLKKFKVYDPGYIIPMANNRSCGNVLGIDMKGLAPIVLHYIICIYRSFGFKNKWGIVKSLLKRAPH